MAASFRLSTYIGIASTCQSALHVLAAYNSCRLQVATLSQRPTHLLVCPMDERMPTKPLCPEGPRMDLPVSLPREITPKLAEAAAAGPPELPAVLRSRS